MAKNTTLGWLRGGATDPAADAGPSVVARESRRWAQLILGLFVYGLACALMIRSEFGLGPWDAFHVACTGSRG